MSDSGSAAPALDDVEVLDLDLGFDLRIAKNWFCSMRSLRISSFTSAMSKQRHSLTR